MVKLFNKLLARSNSYNYYKSNYNVLKKQLVEFKAEKKELQESYQNTKNEIYANTNEFQNAVNLINNSLKNLQETQNNLEENHQNMLNEIHTNIILQNVSSIYQKSKNGKKINIVFIINFRNAVMDKLINLFEKDSLFNPTLLIIPYDLHGLNIFEIGLNEHQLKEYNDNFEYFQKKGFNVIKGYDTKQKTLIDIELELMPDIIFYHTPWDGTFPEEFRIKNLPTNILFCYVPYGIHASHIVDGQFNRELQNKAWKIFYQTNIHRKLAIKYSNKGLSNVVLTGSPKMDSLTDGSHKKNPYPWKNMSHQKKRVIWAPHHSIKWGICFSTFHKNYKFFYNLAKENPEIEWVFKPHPNLRHYHLISSQIFPDDRFSNENLDKYYNAWNNLPNATVYERGDYHNMFATSDAMITDSVSFLSEYLYSGHPGLFLTNATQKFNEYGQIIKNAWYQIDGTDFKEIENFINAIVINGEDPLKPLREDIYNKYLKTNGTASEKIYKYIKSKLT